MPYSVGRSGKSRPGGSWFGVFSGFLWGGLVRLFLVNHLVWSINSVCHIYGSSDYVTQDHSRNNYWLMLPSLGFSLHNNHHAFPKAASTSHVWWQIDLCGLVIRLLAACGLAHVTGRRNCRPIRASIRA